MRSGGGGQHDAVGARLDEFLFRRRELTPGDDVQVGVEIPRGQGNEHIVGIVGQGRHERGGTADPRPFQGVLLGGVVVNHEESAFTGLGDSLRIAFEDDKAFLLFVQLPGQDLTHPAEPADDDVFVEPLDLAADAPHPQRAVDFIFGHHLDECSDDIEGGGNAEDNDHRGVQLHYRRQRLDFLETNCRDDDGDHVDRLNQTPTGDPVAGHRDDEDGRQREQADSQVSKPRAHV